MRAFLLTIVMFFLITVTAWANVIQLTPGVTLLDSGNPSTNDSSNSTFTINGGNALVFNFSLASIPAGHRIVQAVLHRYDNTRSFQQSLVYYRLLVNPTISQATWNSYSTGNNWSTAGANGLSIDYTTTAQVSSSAQNGAYNADDITVLTRNALTAGSGQLSVVLRSPTNGAGFGVNGPNAGSNQPYLVITTAPIGQYNTWYVDDGGTTFGTDATHCNGTSPAVYTAGNGPNCAVNDPRIITDGTSGNLALMAAGDTVSINGDSHTSYAFTVSGVTTGPALNDTYSNNGITYTVTVPLPTGLTSGTITMSGSGAPTATGSLAVVSGSGDATINFSAEGAAQAMFKETSQVTLPGGVSLAHKSQMIGTGSHYPQIWGSSVGNLIEAWLSYQYFKNLDLTTHDNCITNGPLGPGGATFNPDGFRYVCGSGSTGTNTGVLWGGTGLDMENVLIHQFFNGMNNNINGNQTGGTVGNIVLMNVKVFGNPEQGAIVGNSQAVDNVMNGTIYVLYSEVQFSGCGQRYPLQDTSDLYNNIAVSGFPKSVDNEANYYNCWGQSQNGYGDGLGFGGSHANAGNWIVIGSSLSFNVQDGMDTLHGAGTGTVAFIRGRSEGNGGQDLKLNGKINILENSMVNGDCGRWIGAPEASTTLGSTNPGGNVGLGFPDVCRAAGDNLVFPMAAGTQVYIYGNTINANGIGIEPGNGTTCDSTTVVNVYNNIVNCGGNAFYDGFLMSGSAFGNEQPASFLYFDGINGNGGGACEPVSGGGNIILNEDYNVVYNCKNSNAYCGGGAHDKCGVSPKFTSEYSTGTITVNNASNSVTGTGTNWTSAYVGELIGFGTTSWPSVSTWYVISAVNSTTSITLATNYSGSNLSGSSYVINMPIGTASGPASYYYHGTNMTQYNFLRSDSPTIQAGSSTLTWTDGTADYYNNTQNSPPNIGAVQSTGAATLTACGYNNQSCTQNSDCCNYSCVNATCVNPPDILYDLNFQHIKLKNVAFN